MNGKLAFSVTGLPVSFHKTTNKRYLQVKKTRLCKRRVKLKLKQNIEAKIGTLKEDSRKQEQTIWKTVWDDDSTASLASSRSDGNKTTLIWVEIKMKSVIANLENATDQHGFLENKILGGQERITLPETFQVFIDRSYSFIAEVHAAKQRSYNNQIIRNQEDNINWTSEAVHHPSFAHGEVVNLRKKTQIKCTVTKSRPIKLPEIQVVQMERKVRPKRTGGARRSKKKSRPSSKSSETTIPKLPVESTAKLSNEPTCGTGDDRAKEKSSQQITLRKSKAKKTNQRKTWSKIKQAQSKSSLSKSSKPLIKSTVKVGRQYLISS